MLIQKVIQAIQPLQVIGNTDNLQFLHIQHLLIDSRQLGNAPINTLFFAFKTSNNNGATYIPNLIQRGVRCFVIEQNNPILPELLQLANSEDNPVFILVNDTLNALQQLAIYKRSLYHGPVIGITGSNGKTVVKEWLYQLLKEDYHITRSPKSYNSQIGVPLSIWQLSDQTELAIFEAGISEQGEMQRLQAIIQPTIGVITYIGPEHGVMAMADGNQIIQVFTNIVRNAVQAMEGRENSDIIIIMKDVPHHQNEAKGLAVNSHWVEISFLDNGPGIPKDIQDKVFVPNFTTKNTGAGLGLAISRNIVEGCGGKITFKTSKKGTVFFVYLKKK